MVRILIALPATCGRHADHLTIWQDENRAPENRPAYLGPYCDVGQQTQFGQEQPLPGGVQFVRAGVAWLDFHWPAR
jgi:hypothetical protein